MTTTTNHTTLTNDRLILGNDDGVKLGILDGTGLNGSEHIITSL